MLIDTHFHLDLMENMQLLIKQFRGANVGAIAVGTTPLAYKQELQFIEGVDSIRIGLGFHPQLVEKREYEIDLFLQQLKDARFIGEVIRNIPADRILLETDAPFTMKFNFVSDLNTELGNIAKEISYIRGDDIIDQIEENPMKLFY